MTANNPCKICMLPDELVTEVLNLRNKGKSFTNISSHLLTSGHRISQSSVIRHFQNHVGKKSPTKVSTPEKETKESLGSVDLGPDGGEFKDIKTDKPITDWRFIFERFNLSPDEFEIVGNTVRMSNWQQSKRTDTGDRDVVNLYSYRASFRRVVIDGPTQNLTNLLTAVRERAKEIPLQGIKRTNDLGIMTCFADLQAGKNDHRGGTEELLERAYNSLYIYEQFLIEQKPEEILFADMGDIVEGFNSTSSEMFTNDLSIMDQVDLAHTLVSEFLSVSAKHTNRVIATGVPSNHSAWRNGKNYLGTPADDWGLHILRMVEKEYQKYDLTDKVEFVYPEWHSNSINVELMGVNIGMTHGDAWSGGPKNAETWWQKQQHGGGPTAVSDILVHAHYHTFGAWMGGRTRDDRQKYIISASTLDSGSSWYANGGGGGDSDAGLTVFGVRKNEGLDLSTLRVLK